MNSGIRDPLLSQGLDAMKTGFTHPGVSKPKPEDKWPTIGKVGGGRAKPKPVEPTPAELDAEEKASGERANSPEPEKHVDRTVVKITHFKWEKEKITIGETTRFEVDVVIPEQYKDLTRITCSLEQQMRNGAWKAVTANFEPCYAKDGKAICELTVPESLKQEDGSKSEKILFRPLAKHAYSDQAHGPTVEALPWKSTAFESVIYYSPLRGEYLIFESEEEYKSILPELEEMKALQGKGKEAIKAGDATERKKVSEEIATKAKELFDEVKVVGKSEPLVEELVLVRKPIKWATPPGWAYIRPKPEKKGTPLKGKWRKDSDPELKKNLDDLFKKAPGSKEHSPFFTGDLTLKLFKTKPLEKKWVEWESGVKKEGNVHGQGFTFSKEAAVSRLTMGWDGVEGTADLKEKRIKIGLGGQVKYEALAGRMECEFPIPEKGLNILTLLKRSIYLDPILEKNRQCLMRFNVKLKAEAYAGLTVSAAMNILDLDLTREKLDSGEVKGRKAKTGVEAKGFAGAKADTGLTVGIEWTAPDRGKFESLGNCGAEAGGSAGIGAEFAWKIEYRDGIFYFHGGASLTVALGLKGKFSFELGVAEGSRFIGYLFHCMDFHFVGEIEKAAFETYKNFSFTLMTLGETTFTAEKAIVDSIVSDFPKWLEETQGVLDKVKENILSSSAHSSSLAVVPPEALGQAIITIMRLRESDDFRAIMSILNSTVRRGSALANDPDAGHKLKWTIRALSNVQIPDIEGPAKEQKKQEALHQGIKRIEDFGNAVGDLDRMKDKTPNRPFIAAFRNLLSEYGVK